MTLEGPQCLAVCRALLDLAGLDTRALWSESTGPTALAHELLRDPGDHDDPKAETLLRLAFDLWGDNGGALVVSVLHGRLTGPELARVGALLAALAEGPEAVDAWLEG